MATTVGQATRFPGRDPVVPGPASAGAGRSPAHDPGVWADHVRIARDGDPGALERLVIEYESYARSLAGRMHRGHEPREDLDQIALEALVLALQRFDPTRGLPFPAFATPTILGSIRRHYRDHGWLVKVPRRIHEYASAERQANERLTHTLGRVPTEAEVATEMAMDPAAMQSAAAALHARATHSLDAPLREECLADQMGLLDAEVARVDDRVTAAAAIRDLDRDSRRLLRLYFFEDMTQTQIADIIGVSQMQVSRLLRDVLGQVRNQVLADVA